MIARDQEFIPCPAQEDRADIQARALRIEAELFALPPALDRMNHLLSAVPVDLRSLEDTTKEIPDLAADALKLCNSSLFDLSQPVASLEQAVIIMDALIVRTLLFTCWLIRHAGDYVSVRERQSFWRHSLLVAQLSRRIAEWTDFSQTEQVFLSGLFHDVGILPFLTLLSREGKANPGGIFEDVGDSIELQRRRFGTDHCELGLQMGSGLGLPLPLIEVAARHHQRRAVASGMPLLCFVSAAELISQATAGAGRQNSSTIPAGQWVRNALAEYLPGLTGPASLGLVEALESDLRSTSAQITEMPGNVWKGSISHQEVRERVVKASDSVG